MSADQTIRELSTVVLRPSSRRPARGTAGHRHPRLARECSHYLVEFAAHRALVVEVERDDIRLVAAFT